VVFDPSVLYRLRDGVHARKRPGCRELLGMLRSDRPAAGRLRRTPVLPRAARLERRSGRALLRASYAALAPGGLLLDHDVHVNADKTGPLPARGVLGASHARHDREVLVYQRTDRDALRRRLHGGDLPAYRRRPLRHDRPQILVIPHRPSTPSLVARLGQSGRSGEGHVDHETGQNLCVSPKVDRVLLSAEEWQVLVAWSCRRRQRHWRRRRGQDTHWSTRLMASVTGMSQSAVSRIWRAFGLKPHAVDAWMFSMDPQLVPALCSPPSMWAAARRPLATAGVTIGKVKDWSIAGSLS
jgi:hypothetical protein